MSMDASLEPLLATKSNISPTSFLEYSRNSQLDLPEKLAYLVNYSQMFMLVSGNVGSTVRLRDQLTIELQTNHTVFSIDVSALNVESLSKSLLEGFQKHHPHQDSSNGVLNPTNKLRSFCDELKRSFVRAVLVVSAARSKDGRVLAELMDLSEKTGFSLVIFSDKSIATKRVFRSHSNSIYAVHLGPLGVLDLRRYLRRSLPGHTELSSQQMDTLLRNSTGDYEKMDELVEDILSEPRQTIGLSMIHVSVITTALLVFLSGYFFTEETFQALFVEEGTALVEPTLVEPAAEFQPFLVPITSDDEKTPIGEATLGKAHGSDAEMSQVITGGTVAIDGARELTVIAPTLNNSLDEPSSVKRVFPTALDRTIAGNSTRYTLQLVGSKSEDAIRSLVAEHSEGPELVYFKTRRGAEAWYILTAGSFESRDSALSAILTLPIALQDMKPWARNVDSINET